MAARKFREREGTADRTLTAAERYDPGAAPVKKVGGEGLLTGC
jgi:hypothetical protein